jgi:D-glycero-alpha-D-manno-heptose-7-phosphate kinase
MIITRTPYRLSLFGGGSDFPEWFSNYGGSVLSLAIDKYCYISIRELPPFFEHNFRVSYSVIELAKNVQEITHPAVREGFKKYLPGLSLELHHHGDLPSRSGIGSSSAFAVGLIKAASEILGNSLDKQILATEAIHFEREVLKETVGYQDQIASAFGGLNLMNFRKDGSWSVRELHLPESKVRELEERIVLLYTGVMRFSSDVSKTLLTRLDDNTDLMLENSNLARNACELLEIGGDLANFGPMLRTSWDLKRKMNPSSTRPELESIYRRALKIGAEGGKILGAGGGGFFMFWVDPDFRDTFIEKMSPNVCVPITLDKFGATRLL